MCKSTNNSLGWNLEETLTPGSFVHAFHNSPYERLWPANSLVSKPGGVTCVTLLLKVDIVPIRFIKAPMETFSKEDRKKILKSSFENTFDWFLCHVRMSTMSMMTSMENESGKPFGKTILQRLLIVQLGWGGLMSVFLVDPCHPLHHNYVTLRQQLRNNNISCGKRRSHKASGCEAFNRTRGWVQRRRGIEFLWFFLMRSTRTRDPAGDAENNLPQIPLHSGGTTSDHVRGMFNDGPRHTGSSLLALLRRWHGLLDTVFFQLLADGRGGTAMFCMNVTFWSFVLLFFCCFFCFILFPHPSLLHKSNCLVWYGLAVHQQSVLPSSLLEPVWQIGPLRPAHHPELLGYRRAGGAVRHQTGLHLGARTREQLLNPGRACRRLPSCARRWPGDPRIFQGTEGAQL